MSYFDDFGDSRAKIPYDDIPITRNERAQRSYGSSSRGGFGMGKFPMIVISFIVVLNLILSAVCIYTIKNTKTRTINNYVIEMGASSEVSSAVKNSALMSSVCVAAGGNCSTESSFYTSALSRGSGVIYKVVKNSTDSNKGTIYFATCYHVISGHEDNAWVLLPSTLKPISVTTVAYSSHYDIAVLKYETSDLEGVLGGCTAVSVFDSVYASFGEKVFAIGNSLSSGLSITEGLISQINAQVRIASNAYLTRTLQTSAEINPGNSGGGLFNSSGKFIGLVNAKRHSATSGGETFTVVGTSYAIPSSIVCGVVEKLILTQRKPTKVNLGVTFENYESYGKTIEYVDYDGQYRPIDNYSVIVKSVTPGSVSYGKLRAGDMVESIEFYTIGSDTPIRVKMYNQYIFDDYSFIIKEGSDIKIYLTDENEISEKFITVSASSIVTVSD